MQEVNIINELKRIEVLIGKKMFALSKLENINYPPSPLQFKILDCLLATKNEFICQRDLEKKLNVSRATISGVLLTMEKNGIIIRVASSVDGRSKNIKLTNKSIERFTEMKNISNKINEEVIKDVSGEDLDTFLRVLKSMEANLEKLNNY